MEQEVDDYQVRLFFFPDQFISPILGEIWRINMKMKIIVTFTIQYPLYLNTKVVC
jgi:hypothetical protein